MSQQFGPQSGMLEIARLSGHARGAMGAYTAALACALILTCISLGVYVQYKNQADETKRKTNVVIGTLAAAVGVGSLALISAFAYIGKTNKREGQMQRQRLQHQVQQLRRGRGGQGQQQQMQQDFGDFM